METDGRLKTAPIEGVTIIHKHHRVRDFMHRLVPTLIDAPEKRETNDIAAGDSVRFPDGQIVRITQFWPSAETTVRYGGSDIPLPVGQLDDVEPQAVPQSNAAE